MRTRDPIDAAGCRKAVYFGRVTRHAAALFLFATLTVIWMWPIVHAPWTAVPGAGAGDNFLFVWNLWWTKRSLLAGVSPLWCPLIFVPYGVDLTLHTHTLLPTAIAGLLVRDVIAGTNAIVCAHLLLNFVTGYGLAWRLTRDWPAAVLGALLVGWSPYVGERLLGHFNLIAVWVFPLTAWLTLATLDGSRRAAVLLGIALAAIAYLEYYYAVYAAALIVVFVVAQVCPIERRQTWTVWPRRVLGAFAILIIMTLVVAAVVLATGGTVLHPGGAVISLRSAGNPLAVAWLLSLMAAGVWIASRRRIRVDRPALAARLGPIATAVAVAVLCTLPLLVAVTRVWMRGDYVSQRYLWRSAPKGIDLATLVLGNPRGLVWGGGPLRAYARFGIDEIEQTAWFPPAALCLCAFAISLRRRNPIVRLWTWTTVAFSIWALGPYLAAFGKTLPLPLPAILLRYVPIVANARVPSRAIVIVYVAVAMLAAIGFAALRERKRTAGIALLGALTVIDVLPARPPLFAVERPAIYEILRQRPEEGAVCELPLGLRDSFGETGGFDGLVLWHQTLHDRGMAGGFVSRLPPRITAGYQSSPIFGPLLRLSAGGTFDATPPGRDEAIDALHHAGIRFIVLNRAASPPALITFVRQLRLTQIAADDSREVLLVAK